MSYWWAYSISQDIPGNSHIFRPTGLCRLPFDMHHIDAFFYRKATTLITFQGDFSKQLGFQKLDILLLAFSKFLMLIYLCIYLITIIMGELGTVPCLVTESEVHAKHNWIAQEKHRKLQPIWPHSWVKL